MSLTKLYDRINWSDNTAPDINASNLNRMSKALDDIDDRVIDIADTLMTTVPEIREDLAEAAELVQDAEAITTHPPIIGQNGNWWTWDTSIDAYADSGIDAGVSVNVGTTTTLPAGSDATVENVGTDTDPIFNFGIPQGVAGQDGQDGADGQDGVSPEVTIATITGGHTVTITDADHPSGQSFNVMDGQDGQDGQDGAPGVGVPSGGTTGQVLKKKSGTDYDTEWANESGGGGSTVTIDRTGTASSSAVSYQRVGIDGVYTEIDGTKYMEQTLTQSTAGDKTFTFTNAAILSTSLIEVYSTDGKPYKSITTSAGSVAIVYTMAAAESLTVRIYIK